jgi:excinuclease ABC subunit C
MDRKVEIKVVKRGRKARLVDMANRNARLIFYQSSGLRHDPLHETGRALRELRAVLGLKDVPERIEGLDISSIGGRDVTASVVVFKDGRPEKGEYRRLRISSGDGGDVAAMKEALSRRYSKHSLPDLILLDGGLPQLAAARRVSSELGLEMTVVALAKEHEDLYIPGRPAPLNLAGDSPALGLLRKVRDESHRFAKNYHRMLRNKRLSESLLDEIPAVCGKR